MLLSTLQTGFIMQTEVKNKRYVVSHDTGVVDEYDREHIEQLRKDSEQQANDANALVEHYADLIRQMNESIRDVD